MTLPEEEIPVEGGTEPSAPAGPGGGPGGGGPPEGAGDAAELAHLRNLYRKRKQNVLRMKLMHFNRRRGRR